jgi:hypothetical protein
MLLARALSRSRTLAAPNQTDASTKVLNAGPVDAVRQKVVGAAA